MEKTVKIVEASFHIEDSLNGDAILEKIERCGRTAYKSEAKITKESTRNFVARILKSGHESVIEHVSVTVRIVCDRGVSHEIVRHRIASYTQESTRYCDYRSAGQITVIAPREFNSQFSYAEWQAAMQDAEQRYNNLRDLGEPPQIARSVLPNSLKTEIVVTMNLREWRHFFKLRTASAAHPQMREITIPLLAAFQSLVPVVFEDIVPE